MAKLQVEKLPMDRLLYGRFVTHLKPNSFGNMTARIFMIIPGELTSLLLLKLEKV